MKQIKSVCLIGAGRVSYHLGKAIKNSGFKIIQVYNRTNENAIQLAEILNCNYTSDIQSITNKADLYFFSVSDSAIIKILEQRSWKGMLLVHTSGNIPASIFKPFTKQYGVIYPLQSFTKERQLDLSKVPFFTEADSEDTLSCISEFTRKISEKVINIEPGKKEMLHLAAVFASNFSNHMYFIAYELLKRYNIPFSYLEALVKETAEKAFDIDPYTAQTGPALRNDESVLKRHIEILEKDPDWQKIYTFVSENIKKNH